MKISDLSAGKMPAAGLSGLILTCDKQVAVNGNAYLSGSLTDKDNTIAFKVWDNIPLMSTLLTPGTVIEITQGATEEYQGRISLKIVAVTVKSAAEKENYIPSSYLDSAYVSEMITETIPKELAGYNIDVTPILEYLTRSNMLTSFLDAPAGVSKHHAYRRGLVTHCIEVTDLARSVYKSQSRDPNIKIDAGVLLAAAIFHDVGKLMEYNTNDLGLFTGMNSNGILRGHSFMGASMLSKLMHKPLSSSPGRLVNLVHCVISHHGLPEWGAAVVPKTAEALILHHCDMLSSRTGTLSEEGARNLAM